MGIFKPGPGGQPRASTGQSIRGRISGPIALQNSLDDEFPFRCPVAQMQSPDPPTPALPSTISPSPDVPASSRLGPPASGGLPRRAPVPVVAADAPSHQDSMRLSAVSVASRNTSQGRDMPQRKKSMLRSTLGRIFGRKKKDGSGGSSDMMDLSVMPIEEDEPYGSDRSSHQQPAATESKRSNSMPMSEFGRPLRSHSVGPDDITAIESVRTSLQNDLGLSRRRAATTSTRAPAHPRRRDTTELAGLTPRPASAHGRVGRAINPDDHTATGRDDLDDDDGHSDDPSEIGKAITSDGRQSMIQHRRRSRSLSGLVGLDSDMAEIRRRSDEIRYWRQSYDAGYISHLGSNEPATTATDDAAIVPEPLPLPLPQPQPLPLAQSGDAEPLASSMAGFEARLRRLEEMLSSPDPASLLLSIDVAASRERVPRDAKSNLDSNASSPRSPDALQSTRASLGDSPVPVGLLHPPPPPPKPSVVRVSRPATTSSTLRGVASLPSLAMPMQAGPVTPEHYNALLSLIQSERCERQELASQLRKLERHVALMTATTGGSVGHPSFQTEPPLTAKSFGERSVFEKEDDGDDGERARFRPEDSGIITHAVGEKEVDGDDDHDDDDNGGGGDNYDTASCSDEFLTPRQERPHAVGAFGEELRETHGGKKAARTLSLSQMTLEQTAT